MTPVVSTGRQVSAPHPRPSCWVNVRMTALATHFVQLKGQAMKIKYNDYPIEECIKEVEKNLLPKGHTVHQKWTCKHCGARQTMEEPNTFHRTGRCGECGGVTFITKCNYLAVMTVRTGA